jgi:hypothetical protein
VTKIRSQVAGQPPEKYGIVIKNYLNIRRKGKAVAEALFDLFCVR